MKEYVNWAILAPGMIAETMAKAMSETAKTNSKIRLYAVGSRNYQKAKDFAQRWGFTKAYGNYEELLLDPEVDAVYIANPHAFHYETTMAALAAGKHVLCEKPAGCNSTQLFNMIKKARAKKLFFMEAMWTAFNPCISKIKDEIYAGTIGDVVHIESKFMNRLPYDGSGRLWDPEQAGGALLDLGIYNIYYSMLINDFFAVKDLSSNVKMYKGVDAWEGVNITFDNGVTASFQASCDRSSGSDTHDACIFGTKGFITTKDFFMAQKAEIHTYKNQWGNSNEVTKVIEEPFKVNGYEYELISATEDILSGRTESSIHPHLHSRIICSVMDDLRRQWNFIYPFETGI